MKKFIILLIAIYLSVANIPTSTTSAKDIKFARATEPTNLFKLSTTTNDLNEVICIIEQSYFVEIINDNGDNYKVNYNGQIGFVKKNDVQAVQGIPNTPFPNNIKIIVGSTCNLRSSPTTKSSSNNIITTVYANETNLIFIGRIFADEAIDFGGTTWYLVKYGEYTGYIYNKYIKSITPIYENIEQINLFTEPISTNTNPLVYTPSLIIIILLLLPVIAILLILYLPRKQFKKDKKPHYQPPDNF